MPSYAYRAVHSSGRIACGEMAAANENELAHYLNQAGMELIGAKEANKTAFVLPSLFRKISPRILAGFCARMHDLLQAGIAFPDALKDVAATTDNAVLTDALVQISCALSNGNGIAASFALYPHLFPPVFIAIVGAGERSGDMTEIFRYLAHYTDTNARTQERLRRALRYPLFLLVVAGGAVAFMMTTVVPQVVQFLRGIDGHLPLATRILISVSAAFADDGGAVLLGLIGLAALILALRQMHPPFALTFDRLLLRLPVVGAVITKSSLSRFAHSFSLLFRSGCDIPHCLRQASDTLGNRFLRAGVETAEQRVQSGSSLSAALEGVMPAFAVGLLRTGERSGNLGKGLDDLTEAYDREAQAAADTFIGLLEPCLTLVIGGILAWTVIAMLGPLYGSLSVLGGRI